jgi:H+/Cl- antiporter ClcA
VGFVTYGFLKCLEWGISLSTGTSSYYYFSLPLGLLASALLVKYLAPNAKGHGTEKVIEAVHKKYGRIEPMVVPVKLVATVITFMSGGSVGKEGPCAQVGAGVTSILADIFRFNDIDRKKLVICGISAGFAAVFGTPVAGAIFAIEVLFVGAIMYEVLLPSFVAGMVGYQVVTSLGMTFPYTSMDVINIVQSNPMFLEAALGGVFFGLCSLLFIEIMLYGERLIKRYNINIVSRAIVGGIALICLTLVFSTEYLGLGEHMIMASLRGEQVVVYAFLLKMLFTVITLICGGSGGIVTPIFFIGATAGSAYATVLGLNRPAFAAIGLVSLLAGAANTPIAATIMAVEIFGPKMAPYAAIAAVISFLITGHRSVYPSQVVSIAKSSSLNIKMGEEIENVIPEFQRRKRSLVDIVWNMGSRVKELFGKHNPQG